MNDSISIMLEGGGANVAGPGFLTDNFLITD